jgi:hypothetical protein
VARVDGRPIFAAEVQRHAAKKGLQARDALNQLIDLELLAGEAARRLAVDAVDVQAAGRRAAVQRLLEEHFDADHRKADIPDQLVKAVYESRKLYFVHPPMRRVHNLLAIARPPRPGSNAEQKLQQFVVEARRLGGDSAAVLALAEQRGLKIDRDLRTFTDDRSYLAPWVTAVMNMPARIDAISDVFQTEYGWHAVLLIELIPARNEDLAAAADEVRERIVSDWRRRELDAWIDALVRRYQVRHFPEALAANQGTTEQSR